jgi:predicted ArsR family transcriptional regulator
VGRAPKRYRTSELEVSWSVPARRYDLAGQILLDAFDAGGPIDQLDPVRRSAFQRGFGLGQHRRQVLRRGRLGPERAVGEACGVLEQLGFEPAEQEDGVVLRNCPFRALAQRSPRVVCALNAAFIDGVLRGLGNDSVSAELVPEDGFCCVRIRRPEQ